MLLYIKSLYSEERARASERAGERANESERERASDRMREGGGGGARKWKIFISYYI